MDEPVENEVIEPESHEEEPEKEPVTEKLTEKLSEIEGRLEMLKDEVVTEISKRIPVTPKPNNEEKKKDIPIWMILIIIAGIGFIFYIIYDMFIRKKKKRDDVND